MERIALGVDIGGSHITCQLVNLERNLPLENTWCRMPVDSGASKNEILDTWVAAILTATNSFDLSTIAGIGFAMPGPFDYQNGIAWFQGVQKFENLYGVNIREEIQNRLGWSREVPVRFLNDASSFAVGEAWMGVATNYKRIIALTMGTGFGSTFIHHQLPVAGIEGVPADGFLYHIPFKASIADDYFSTRWFLKAYSEKTGQQIQGVQQLAEQAANDPVIADLFTEFGRNLGEFIAPWVRIFDADCLVLGGNISRSFPLFQSSMEAQLAARGVGPALCISTLEEQAALFGSSKLCDETFYAELIKTNIL